MAPKYFSSILCVKMSADNRGIHNASCGNRTPCVLTGHSIYNAYEIGDNV